MESKNSELLMYVTLDVSAELGQCKMRVRDILQLGVGSLLALDRSVDDPIDLLVNEKVVARGEIIAIEERFGVRITELAHSAAGEKR
jgi:flagellar motor switch protein FliN/FliY